MYARTYVQAPAHGAVYDKESEDPRQAGRSVTRNCISEQRFIETQTADNFRRNSCACGNPSSPAPHFQLFQWRATLFIGWRTHHLPGWSEL